MLLGIAAASSGTGVPAGVPPASDPDAALTALMDPFEQLIAAYETAQRYYTDCEGRYFDLAPMPPDELTFDGPLGHLLDSRWSIWSTRQLRRLLKDGDGTRTWDARPRR